MRGARPFLRSFFHRALSSFFHRWIWAAVWKRALLSRLGAKVREDVTRGLPPMSAHRTERAPRRGFEQQFFGAGGALLIGAGRSAGGAFVLGGETTGEGGSATGGRAASSPSRRRCRPSCGPLSSGAAAVMQLSPVWAGLPLGQQLPASRTHTIVWVWGCKREGETCDALSSLSP